MSPHLAGRSLTKRRFLIRLQDHHASHGRVAQGRPGACRAEEQTGRRGATEMEGGGENQRERQRHGERMRRTERRE